MNAIKKVLALILCGSQEPSRGGIIPRQFTKTRGFRFEATHLTQRVRIKKMMAVLAIGFCWAHKTGEWHASRKPIRFAKHRHSLRPQSSYMRYGLDYLRDIITNPFKKITAFREIVALLESLLLGQTGGKP